MGHLGPASTSHLGPEGPVMRKEDGKNPGGTALGREEREAKEDGMNPGRAALGRGRSGAKDGTADREKLVQHTGDWGQGGSRPWDVRDRGNL